MEYCSATAISKEQTIELDYLAFNAFTIETLPIDVKKGYFVHITRDNELIADGIVSDIRPEKNYQKVSIRPLQALFDVEVFYSDISDCITWIANNISAQFISNSDTVQNRPIDLTYIASSEALPITEDIDSQRTTTLNILSIIQNALKTYSVLTNCWIDMATKRIKCNIQQITNAQVVEADLDNILEVSITLGDSYGSSNKVYIKKYHYIEELDEDGNMVVKQDEDGNRVTEDLDIVEYYLHPDGTIDKTNSNRIYPVFWKLASVELNDADSRLEDYTLDIITTQTWNSYDNNTKATKKNEHIDDFIRTQDYKLTMYIINIVGQTAWDNYDNDTRAEKKDYYKDSYLADNDAAWTEYTKNACGQEVWNGYTANQKTIQKNNNKEAFDRLIYDEWDAAADAKAYEILNPQKYDQEIVLSFYIDDLIVHPMDMVIGTVVDMYYKGEKYTSILAARSIKGNKVTLTFGALRTELTKKMNLEKIENTNKTSS